MEPDGEYASGMDYSRIVPILVEAIKRQQLQIESLRREMGKLKTKP